MAFCGHGGVGIVAITTLFRPTRCAYAGEHHVVIGAKGIAVAVSVVNRPFITVPLVWNFTVTPTLTG
jgi:hypothetical protein